MANRRPSTIEPGKPPKRLRLRPRPQPRDAPDQPELLAGSAVRHPLYHRNLLRVRAFAHQMAVEQRAMKGRGSWPVAPRSYPGGPVRKAISFALAHGLRRGEPSLPERAVDAWRRRGCRPEDAVGLAERIRDRLEPPSGAPWLKRHLGLATADGFTER